MQVDKRVAVVIAAVVGVLVLGGAGVAAFAMSGAGKELLGKLTGGAIGKSFDKPQVQESVADMVAGAIVYSFDSAQFKEIGLLDMTDAEKAEYKKAYEEMVKDQKNSSGTLKAAAKFDMGLAQPGATGEAEVSLDLDFKVNATDMTAGKFDADMTMDVEFKGEGMSLNGSGRTIILGDDMYFKVDTVPAAGLFGDVDLEGIKGQWYTYDVAEATKALEDQSSTITGSEDKITKEDIESIRQFIMSDAVANTLTRLDDRTFGGRSAFCYEMKIEDDDVQPLVDEVNKRLENEDDRATADDVQEMKDLLNSLTVVMCADKDNGRIYFMDIDASFTSEGSDATFSLEENMTYSDTPYSIEKPEGAKPIEEMTKDLGYGADSEYEQLMQQYEQSGSDEFNPEDYDFSGFEL